MKFVKIQNFYFAAAKKYFFLYTFLVTIPNLSLKILSFWAERLFNTSDFLEHKDVVLKLFHYSLNWKSVEELKLIFDYLYGWIAGKHNESQDNFTCDADTNIFCEKNIIYIIIKNTMNIFVFVEKYFKNILIMIWKM